MDEFVSIVIVSHSNKIALGIKEMIQQITKDIVVEVAGGTKEGEIGTSLESINEAINKATSSQGVLVFYDIGSAKMNAQLAIEMNKHKHVTIVDAPLVEGAYIAAVKASIGKSALEIKKNLLTYFPNFFEQV